MAEQFTERGFAVYAELEDDYGADVQVIESSAAMVEGQDGGPWVWIFVRGGEVDGNKGSAHLALAQARQVRDALSEFIEGAERSERGEEDG